MFGPRLLLLLVASVGLCQVAEARGCRAKRSAADFAADLWTSPIPYTIDSQLNDQQRQKIEAVIQLFRDNTCIKFEEKMSSPQLEYSFETDGSCKSAIGAPRDGNNRKVYLSSGCFNSFTITHETMHALGFRHTHSRHDRDEYVDVKLDQLVTDADKFDYEKLNETENTTNYDIPYEYNSIMHYDAGIRMAPKDEDYHSTMGGKHMIFNDWKLVNLRYKCSEACETPIDCKNGGYQHPRQCEQCVCPQLFKGTYCEEEPEVITLTPGSETPLNHAFPRNTNLAMTAGPDDKVWSPPCIIKSPEGTRIRVRIDNISDMEQPSGHPHAKCLYKAIEIMDGDLTRVGKMFCDNSNSGHDFLSISNVLGYQYFASPGLDFTVNITLTVE